MGFKPANSKIFVFHGKEGPYSDPYSYTEVYLDRYGKEVGIHLGLANWIEVDGQRTMLYGKDYDRGEEIFKELTGFLPYQLIRFKEKHRDFDYYGDEPCYE